MPNVSKIVRISNTTTNHLREPSNQQLIEEILTLLTTQSADACATGNCVSCACSL